MNTKTIELRDRMTLIPMLAIKLQPRNEGDRWLLAKAGYGTRPEEQAAYVLFVQLAGGSGKAHCDPYEWGSSRTYQIAHAWLIENFDKIESGAVVDVEHILNERPEPKRPEREEGQL